MDWLQHLRHWTKGALGLHRPAFAGPRNRRAVPWLDRSSRTGEGGPATRHKLLASDGSTVSLVPTIEAAQRRSSAKANSPLRKARARQKVSEAFAASLPVRSRSGLCGRDEKLAQLIDGVRYRHNHAIVCGPRGSGKTSLARVFGDYADEDGAIVLYMAGADDASFHDLLKPYLVQLPESCCAPGAKDQIDRELEQNVLTAPIVVNLLTHVRYSHLIFIFDEFDRIANPRTAGEFSNLMKLASDACVKVSFVVVGIADNLHDLVTAHPSLRRHLTVITLEPLEDDAIGRIVEECLQKCGFAFPDWLRSLLTHASCGSPYHARFFGMHIALSAADVGSPRIRTTHALAGLRAAYEEWRACNPADAELFDTIAKFPGAQTGRIIRFAQKAADPRTRGERDNSENGSGEAALAPPEELEPALVHLGDHVSFRDSIAPQFLLVTLGLARRSRESSHTEAA